MASALSITDDSWTNLEVIASPGATNGSPSPAPLRTSPISRRRELDRNMVMGICSSSRQSVDATSARQRRPDTDTDAVIDITPSKAKTADERLSSAKLVAHMKKTSSHIRYSNANDTKFIEQRVSPSDARNDSRSTEKTTLSSAAGERPKLPPLATSSMSGTGGGGGGQRRTSLTTLPNVVSSDPAGDQRFRMLQQRKQSNVVDDANYPGASPRPEIIAHRPPTGHEFSPRPVTIKRYSDPAPLFFPNDPGMLPIRDDMSMVSDTSSYVVIHRRVRVAWEGGQPSGSKGNALQPVTRSKSSASESWSGSESYSSYQNESSNLCQPKGDTIDDPPLPNPSNSTSPLKQPNFIRKKRDQHDASADNSVIRNISTPD